MLHNVTTNYFYSQLFWLIVSFVIIYLSFVFFLQPRIERILLKRKENYDQLISDIEYLGNMIEQYKQDILIITKKSNQYINQLKKECINEIQEITIQYKLEYNKRQAKLEKKILKDIENYKQSEDYLVLKKKLKSDINQIFVKYI